MKTPPVTSWVTINNAIKMATIVISVVQEDLKFAK